MIPPKSVAWLFPRPKEYGGLLTVYPIVTKDQQYGLFGEVMTDWYGADSGLWGRGGKTNAFTDKPSYTGEVWSIQRDAMPGYYTTPQQLVSDAQSTAYWSSDGIGDWTMSAGWQSFGDAPYG